MNSKNQIVIFTEIADAHTDDVIRLLVSEGYDPIRLNTNDIPINVEMSFAIDSSSCRSHIKNTVNNRVIIPEEVLSVWWRRPGKYHFPEMLTVQEATFANGEMEHTLNGLWASINCYWISFPTLIREASWKFEQLQRAAKMGFEIPRTLITSNPEKALEFYDSCQGQVVYKVLTDPSLAYGKDKVILDQDAFKPRTTQTTFLTNVSHDLLQTVRLAPCQFQEYIPKRLELRVTVIGNDVFAAEIHSQVHEKTKIDWRNYDVQIPYRKATLPKLIEDRCRNFVQSYDLNFSAMDIILTPDGRYVFLENNPNGQFIFIQKLVPELKMTEALAACLVRGSNG